MQHVIQWQYPALYNSGIIIINQQPLLKHIACTVFLGKHCNLMA